MSLIGHDLSGTYRASEYFPVDTISFSTDGRFTATREAGGYAGYSETLSGKYHKSFGGEYILELTESSSEDPVSQVEFEEEKSAYVFSVKKEADETLSVRIKPKQGYMVFFDETVYFYKE